MNLLHVRQYPKPLKNWHKCIINCAKSLAQLQHLKDQLFTGGTTKHAPADTLQKKRNVRIKAKLVHIM